jgi:acyl-coenzyme A synthetase/AMP-(fatty) acid ligase
VWETLLPRLQDAVLVSSPAHLGRLGGLAGTWRPALVLSAGAPLPPAAAVDAATLFGIAPLEIFGSTETGAVASRSWRTADAPWLPLPGTHVERDSDGRLSLLSPWIEGRHTGDDLVEMVDGGFLLRGRAGRVVKVEGKRVSLPAVEAALARLPQVADAAVTLLDGAREELAAAVVPSAEGRDLLAQLGPFRFGRHLRAMLAERLEPPARPRRWRFVDAIPTAAMGKRQDASIAAMFEELRHG